MLMVPVTGSWTKRLRLRDTKVPMAESNGVEGGECARGAQAR